MASSGHSAIAEHFGGAVVNTSLAADYSLRLPYSTNCARLYVLSAAAPRSVALPNTANIYVPAGPVYQIAVGGASSTLTLRDHIGNSVRAMTVGTGWEVWWTGSAWVTFATATPVLSTSLSATRVPVSIKVATSNVGALNLQELAGYTSTTPAAVTCEIAAGLAIGASSTGLAAITSGTWPSGSTLLLLVGAGSFIAGKGGGGGRGRDGAGGPLSHIGPTSGFAGGPALNLAIDHAIANWGTIQGGGGGGGGGERPAASPFPGGGGGGGAGLAGGAGGAGGGTASGSSGLSGQPGTLQLGGTGGSGIGVSVLTSGAGGAGGTPGTSGSQGAQAGALGGAAGAATQRPVANTQTWIRTGTVLGSNVTY